MNNYINTLHNLGVFVGFVGIIIFFVIKILDFICYILEKRKIIVCVICEILGCLLISMVAIGMLSFFFK